MSKNPSFFKVASLAVLSLVFFLFFRFSTAQYIGLILLLLFLWLYRTGFTAVLVRMFGLQKTWRAEILASFFCFFTVSWLSGVAIVFYQLSDLAAAVILFLTGALSIFLEHRIPAPAAEVTPAGSQEEFIEIPQSKSYIWAFVIFFAFGLFVLWKSRSGAAAITPWQIISGNYIYVYFLAAITLGGLIYSKLKTRTLLVLLILQFLLTVCYLPLSHKLFYGADGWRHIAAENQIAAGDRLEVRNFGGDSFISRINPGILSYSQFWGAETIINRFLKIDLVKITAWTQPVLWSLLFVLLIFELSIAVGWSERKSVLMAYLCLWPFALTVAGAFSLPVNFGFLVWLMLTLLIIRRIRQPRKIQLYALAACGVLSFFGYVLYLILFVLLWAIAELFICLQNKAGGKIKTIWQLFAFAAVLISVPALELITGYAKLDHDFSFLGSIKKILGNFSGYYLASGPRPHIIETGNIFFNQVPSYAFVSNGFVSWRWWIAALMALTLTAAGWGLIKMWKSDETVKKIVAVFSAGIFGSYFLSRYFLSGEHILSRRLEAVFALLCIVCIFYFIQKIVSSNRLAAIVIVLVCAFSATASYSLGPYSQAVSEKSFKAVSDVWSEISQDENYCVISDTYTLLALEAVSAKKVIGGGFPINRDFSQPELVSLYKEFGEGAADDLWLKAKDLTRAGKCYLIVGGEIQSKKFN